MRTKRTRLSINKSLFFLFLLCCHLLAQHFTEAKNGMVVSPTPDASSAGLEILKMGGNAVDAAAATAFALMVTDPAMCSLAGRSQILIRTSDGTTAGIDGATESPANARIPAKIGHGYQTIPVPGSPAALQTMLEQFGSLSLQTVLQPAIELAEQGFMINCEYSSAFERYAERLRIYPGTAAHFLKKNGDFYREGDRFKQPALAATLKKIADSGSYILYRGELAEKIVTDMKANEGIIESIDLRQYRIHPGIVLEDMYRGYRILSRGDQCDGASVIEMLKLLENCNLSEYSLTDYRYIALLAQVNHIGHTDEYLPDWIQMSPATIQRRLREINTEEPFPVTVKRDEEPEGGETNHLSVVDKNGNAVAITQSIGPYFGSKVVNPELGFFYAYSYDMNDDPVPFQREKTSQSPTIVLKDNQPFLVLGSAGSSRIPGSIVQTIVNVIDHRMTLEKAVSQPRIFLLADELRLENGVYPDSVFAILEQLEYQLKLYPERNGWFGRVHAIQVLNGENKKITGAADPRDSGAALGF